jgi:hypothetical protein
MPANRVVILLSPIFVGIAGAIVSWIANHFPGAPKLDASELTAVFIAGSTFAAGKVALWLHGWQKAVAPAAEVQPVVIGRAQQQTPAPAAQ